MMESGLMENLKVKVLKHGQMVEVMKANGLKANL